MNDLDRGLDHWPDTAVTPVKRKMCFMVVVSQTEVTQMKALVREHDPDAFIILSDTTEVLGEGFRLEFHRKMKIYIELLYFRMYNNT